MSQFFSVMIEKVVFPDLTERFAVNIDSNASPESPSYKTRYEHGLVSVDSEYSVLPTCQSSFEAVAEKFNVIIPDIATIEDVARSIARKIGKTDVMLCKQENLEAHKQYALTK